MQCIDFSSIRLNDRLLSGSQLLIYEHLFNHHELITHRLSTAMWLLSIILLLFLLPALIYIFVHEMVVLLITLALFGVVYLYIQLADVLFGGSKALALLATFVTAIPIVLLYRKWKHSNKVKEQINEQAKDRSALMGD